MPKKRSAASVAILAFTGLALSVMAATPASAGSCTQSQVIAVETIEGHFAMVDRMGSGREDRLINRDDLRVVASNSSVPNSVRSSVNYVLADDAFFNRIDRVRNPQLDGLINEDDLRTVCG
ncbi:hypothetical protein [Streptomyces lancefieldiae]|uniref:Uncharacterized protein n=1 Tax=Streptomyces lancefieldiae TaxID=3075520 RepID=A0ABU3B260_9ACTN|nr:hypothetical protein [Streptomyces sp. DSM 40712]MDT0616527.1 hypothetical protein [Streptomyces sp. DSM 40712]